MPITFPTFQELTDRIRADVINILPDLDPTIENSLINALVTSEASRFSDVYTDINRLLREAVFPQTASGEFLDQHGEIFGVSRLQATKAAGIANIEGTATTVIPNNTQFTNSIGNTYITTASSTITTTIQNVTTLTRTGQTAKATFASNHNLASNMTVTIAGAVQTEYNGSYKITVTSPTTFEYTITGSPATPATGTITTTATYAALSIESVTTGASNNLESGAKLILSSPIVGANNNAFVTFNGITGGADIEDDDSYRVRIIDERASFEALFDVAQIRQQVFTVPGVTRVKVKQITPGVGQVTILFVRDDDPGSIIPDAGEIQDVKDVILVPAHTDPNDVFVLAPTPVTTNFTFTALSPDTPELRAEISSRLYAFFREQVDFEETIIQDRYRGIIAATVDPSTGEELETFTLSSPVGNIVVSTNQIAVLGTVTFP